MSYNQFTNPSGGYTKNYPDKGYNYAPADKTYVAPVTPKLVNGESFTYLSTIYDGVGPYHINHFIGYFKPEEFKFNLDDLLAIFYKNFSFIFSIENVAKAVLSDKTFRKNDTIKFTIGGNVGETLQKIGGLMHDDWISIQMEEKEHKSFYGTTLKREWLEASEVIALSTSASNSASVNGIIKHALIKSSIEVNKRHFLAGRRSWRIGYDNFTKLFYIETAALERSSHDIYAKIDETGWLRESINELWINLVVNFAKTFKLTLVVPNSGYWPENYELDKRMVFHTANESKSLDEIIHNKWFSEVVKRHIGLITRL